MEVESKVRRTFLSGIALCVVSGLLLILGTVSVISKTSDSYFQYFVIPSLFLGVGIVAILTSRKEKKAVAKTKPCHIN